jgi:hypothetical protein
VSSIPPGCAVCGRSVEGRLCSPRCVREAVRERERNVRDLRTLRRAGGEAEGAALMERNATLTSALLSTRPRGTDGGAGGDAPLPPSAPDRLEAVAVDRGAPADVAGDLTQPFATPSAAREPVAARSRPVA